MLIRVMLSCQNHIDGLELSPIHSAMLTTWSLAQGKRPQLRCTEKLAC